MNPINNLTWLPHGHLKNTWIHPISAAGTHERGEREEGSGPWRTALRMEKSFNSLCAAGLYKYSEKVSVAPQSRSHVGPREGTEYLGDYQSSQHPCQLGKIIFPCISDSALLWRNMRRPAYPDSHLRTNPSKYDGSRLSFKRPYRT